MYLPLYAIVYKYLLRITGVIMSDPFGLKSQFVSAGTRKFKKFVGNAMDTLSNGRTSLEQVARLKK